MWKKRLIWRNELVMCKDNGNVSNDSDTKSDRDDSSSSGDLLDINTARVSVRNGEFVQDTEGSLLISFHYMPPHNNNNINNSHELEDSKQMRNLIFGCGAFSRKSRVLTPKQYSRLLTKEARKAYKNNYEKT